MSSVVILGCSLLIIKVSYGDFLIVSVLQCWRRIDQAIYERAIKVEPALATLYKSSEQWLRRDDH